MRIACLLAFSLLATTACGEEATFAYPPNGDFGLNVLERERTSVDVEIPYSFRLEASKNAEFTAVMTLLTQIPARNQSDPGVWMFNQSVPATWAITTFDWETGVQRFVAIPIERVAPGVSDVTMTFVGTGSARVDYFEDKDAEPVFSKQVDW